MSLRGGRYERIRPIASGGMATVYLGRAHGHGVRGFERPVAIKVMHDHLATTDEFVSMFLDEARIAARIRHPNVVATIDAVRDDQGLFLVMEFIDGLSVHHIVKAERRAHAKIPLPIAVRVILDTLAGLHAAHELKADDGAPLNLVHRDVSPQNILVALDGLARITDFGIARAETRAHVTRTGQIKGKLAYMSVEQVRSAPVDRRSDVYSTALVLWELLTGTKCFNADSEGAAALMAAEGVKRSPIDANPDVPVSISQCCMRALSIGPNDRYATATEFAEALEDATLDGGVRPAKPREVGNYVRELVERLGTETGSKELANAASAVQAAQGGSNPGIPESSVPSEVSKPSEVSQPSAASSRTGGTTGTKGSIAITQTRVTTGQSRWVLPAAASVAGIVGVAATVWLFGIAPSPSASTPDSGVEGDQKTSVAATSAPDDEGEANVDDEGAKPDQEQPELAASVAASASAGASAPSAEGTKPSPTPQPKSKRPSSKGGTSSPTSGKKPYRPKKL